jgi:hypothetical protein
MANFGAGWPTIIGLHLAHTSTPIVVVAAGLSICCAVVLVEAAASFLPQQSAADAGGRSKIKGVHPVRGQATVAERG